MNTREIASTLGTLFAELVDGAPEKWSYMLNTGDPGLLRSLGKLSAADASRSLANGGTIAGHTQHLSYGISLMNRWAGGERNPWKDADWTVAWRTTAVTDDDWAELRAELAAQAHCWLDDLRQPREVQEAELAGMIGSIAHLAYHLGAIRQIAAATRGPTAEENAAV